MNNNQELVVSHVLMQVKPDQVLDEAKITQLASSFAMIEEMSSGYKFSDAEIQSIVNELQTKLIVRMDRGACLKNKNHVSWYYAAKANIENLFWSRYTTYLYRDAGFNSDVVNSLDAATDEMMDLLENPKGGYSFKRRGLVIGDVQSGKTSTYLALINKAADAGYHIIVLLTGTIEKLRRQTQGRTDEGFVGLDSTAFNRDKNNVFVGVGEISSEVMGWAVTSTTSDFNTGTASKISGRLADISSPVVFVIKKNKSVLEKLEAWLRLFNVQPGAETIDLPMLMIDDEADNASVSTKSGEDPSTINKGIRKILKLFSKSSYVGFTATPFANIFIDPDSTQEMLGDDLFPNDFIYALEAPTNYIGAATIFPYEGKHHNCIKDNSDCELYVPLRHKKTYEPTELPLSLRKAVASFILVNAIRDLRGDETKHRTMMVNISVFVDVQKRIADQLDSYLRDIQREIRNYYMMGNVALQYSTFAFLKDVFDEYYCETEYSWEEIQEALNKAAAPIIVRSVNGGNAARNLNYDECEDNGLRLIAVGGYSLSRGLTLEGLCVSYFYRNTKMYDTLMQMGRWFGYRPHYEDLCQVWINPDAVDWYSYISEASDELKRQVRRMQEENRTPADFGLCVRSDNAALLVTARNKMKMAKDYTMTISLSGNIVETPFIHMSEKILEENFQITKNLIKQIKTAGYTNTYGNQEYALADKDQFIDVSKELVIEFLSAFQSHSMNSHFHTNELVNLILGTDNDSLDKWDVCVASGSGTMNNELGLNEVNCVLRSFAVREDVSAYQMSGSKSRLGNRSYAKAGIRREIAKKIEDGENTLNLKIHGEIRPLNQNVYFKPDYLDKPRNPLLVIYPVQLKAAANDIKDEAAVINNSIPLVGISVGIPAIKGKSTQSYQYKINLVKYRELIGMDEPEEIDDTIED